MGGFSSSEEVTEEKAVDSNGHVNNNIIIQEAKDTHLHAALSEKLLFATYALVALEIIKLAICIVQRMEETNQEKLQQNRESLVKTNRQKC